MENKEIENKIEEIKDNLCWLWFLLIAVIVCSIFFIFILTMEVRELKQNQIEKVCWNETYKGWVNRNQSVCIIADGIENQKSVEMISCVYENYNAHCDFNGERCYVNDVKEICEFQINGESINLDMLSYSSASPDPPSFKGEPIK